VATDGLGRGRKITGEGMKAKPGQCQDSKADKRFAFHARRIDVNSRQRQVTLR
jgi:hypothetical protein